MNDDVNNRVTVRYVAGDRKAGLTLLELARFLDRCQKVGLDPGTSVKVETGWTAQLRSIRVEGETTFHTTD